MDYTYSSLKNAPRINRAGHKPAKEDAGLNNVDNSQIYELRGICYETDEQKLQEIMDASDKAREELRRQRGPFWGRIANQRRA
jgi:hypothetical protein